MRSAMCIQCSMNFPSELAFQRHKKSGHTDMTGGISLNEAPLPPGIPESNLPSDEFLETVKRIEEQKAITAPMVVPDVAPQAPVVPLEPPKPPRLAYKYLGVCPDCASEILTLEIDVDNDNYFVVAYCIREQKQITGKRVPKITDVS